MHHSYLNEIIDDIYLINLPENKTKLDQSLTELAAQGISNVRIIQGTRHEQGQLGIYTTIYNLVSKAYFSGLKNILIFEDDIKFVNRFPGTYSFRKIISTGAYDIIYLGCNTHQPFTEENVIPLCSQAILLELENAYSCHAMILSRTGMYHLLQAIEDCSVCEIGSNLQVLKAVHVFKPIDVLIAEKIQPKGACYATYPMVATQRNSYSDIEKREVDQSYILERFIQHTKNLSICQPEYPANQS